MTRAHIFLAAGLAAQIVGFAISNGLLFVLGVLWAVCGIFMDKSE